MSPRVLAFVGCRLLALYVFLQVIQAQVSNVYFYLQELTSDDVTRVVPNPDFDFYFVGTLINLGICFVLWFGASWLSGRAVQGVPITEKDATTPWSLQSALSVVVIASGFWVLILLVPSLTYVFNRLLQDGRVDLVSLVYVVLAIAVGFVCVFSPRAIAGFIARSRNWSAERPQS